MLVDSSQGRLDLPSHKPSKPKPTPKKAVPKKPAPKTAIAAKRKRRRQKVAAGLLAGKTVTELAKEEGLTRSHLSREANQPETRLLMAELLAEHREQVKHLVAKTLDRIGFALDAEAIELVVSKNDRKKAKDGSTKESRVYETKLAGVDHFARMTGAKRLIEMIQSAAPQAAAESGQAGTITWEAFLHLRERIQPA